jgi:hypothetical protein
LLSLWMFVGFGEGNGAYVKGIIPKISIDHAAQNFPQACFAALSRTAEAAAST